MNATQTKELAAILKQNKLAVLSTVSRGHPESALVAFAEARETIIYFQTRRSSRKYGNLQLNSDVAMVIGWDLDEYITLQCEGIAQELHAGTDEIKELFIKKESPSTREYLDHPETRFFRIKLNWIRYSNYTVAPAKIWEERLER